MNTKQISRIAGGLYLATVLAFIVSNLFIKERLIDAGHITNTLSLVAENAFQYRLAVSIDFLAMVAVMSLAFSLYVILKPINPYLALLALGWRIGEVVLQAGGKIPDYLLLTLSQSAASSDMAGPTVIETFGQILIGGSTQGLWLSFVFLSVGSLFNNYLFYKGRLIPALLAIFGLISTGLYSVGSIAALVVDLPETANMVMMLPMAVFELMLGVYLIAFGVREQSSS